MVYERSMLTVQLGNYELVSLEGKFVKNHFKSDRRINVLLNFLHIIMSIMKFPDVSDGKFLLISKAVCLTIGKSSKPIYSKSISEKSFTIEL